MLLIKGRAENAFLLGVTAIQCHQSAMDIGTDSDVVSTG